MFNSTVDPSIQSQIWKLFLYKSDKQAYLLNSEQRKELEIDYRKIYSLIKSQWRSVTQRQWDNDTDLQNLVILLEKDINSNSNLFSSFSNPKSMMKLAFNILLTISIYNHDNASYIPKMIQLLVPFLSSFCIDVEYNGIDNEIATNIKGEKVPAEEIESDIFWCFYNFYIDNQIFNLIRPSKTFDLKTLFVEAGKLLESYFQSLLQLLFQKHAYSLDFLRNDCVWWFSDIFNVEDLKRLWLSVLVSKNWLEFYERFICALLYSVIPQLGEINPLMREDFLLRFQDIKKNLDLNVILENTKALINLIENGSAVQKQTQEQNQNEGKKSENDVTTNPPQ